MFCGKMVWIGSDGVMVDCSGWCEVTVGITEMEASKLSKSDNT